MTRMLRLIDRCHPLARNAGRHGGSRGMRQRWRHIVISRFIPIGRLAHLNGLEPTRRFPTRRFAAEAPGAQCGRNDIVLGCAG